MTVEEFCEESMTHTRNNQILKVIDLEVSCEVICKRLQVPHFIKKLSIQHRFFPEDKLAQRYRPGVTKYLLFAEEGAVTQWHVDFSATDVFYTPLTGTKEIYFIIQSEENMKTFKQWDEEDDNR